MSVCPWCKSQNPPGVQACLRCGKRAADHPSIAGQGMPSGFDEDDVAAGPALALDLDAGPRSGGVSGGASHTDLGHSAAGDGWGDDEDAGAAGPSLDLDTGDAPLHESFSRQQVASPRPGATSTSSSSLAAVRPEQREAIHAPAKAAGSIDVDPYEVKVLADYGPEPKSIVQAVPYAIKVRLRQRELRAALARVRASLSEAEARRDERFVELGALMRPVVAGSPDYKAFAAPLESAEKTKATREAALSEANSAFRDQAAAIDAEIAALDAPIQAAQREAEAKGKAHQDAETLRAKHEARRKRVEIDVRSAQAKLARPETSQAERAAAQSLIGAAQGERETRAAEEKIAEAAAQQAESVAALARKALSDLEGKVLMLRNKRRDLEKEFSRQGAVRMEGIDAASREMKVALLEIGKRTYKAGPDVEGADMRRKSVADAEAQVKKLQVDMEKHLRALDSADKTAVRNGTIVLGALVGLLVVLFIVWRATRTNPYMQQPSGKTSTTSPAAP